jgi:hypothetical protein
MKKLGEILLDQGLLTPGQLENALRRQSMSGGRLGEHLVQMMLLDETQVCKMLAIQRAVPAVLPSELEEVPEEVIRAVPGELVSMYQIVPFKLLGRRLHVAMLEPDNIEMVDELSHKTGYIIRSYICMESVLHRAMSHYYQITLKSTTRADASVAASMMQDLIVHDNRFSTEQDEFNTDQNLVALDDSGQFALFDRVNILGDYTKSMFLDALGTKEVINYLLQLMEHLCDKVVFMIIDGEKNYYWSDISEFRRGNTGLPMRDRLQKSSFWSNYLVDPEIKFVNLESISGEIQWAPKMLKMERLQAFILVPVHIGNRLTGIVMGGTVSAVNLKEEIETFRKLRVMADCSLAILRCKRTIQEIE